MKEDANTKAKVNKSLPGEMTGGTSQKSPLDTKWVNLAFMQHNPYLRSQ